MVKIKLRTVAYEVKTAYWYAHYNWKKRFRLFFLTENLAIRSRRKFKLECSRVAWTFTYSVSTGHAKYLSQRDTFKSTTLFLLSLRKINQLNQHCLTI